MTMVNTSEDLLQKEWASESTRVLYVQQQPPFVGIFNFRDVGGCINAISGRRLLNEKMIYRSGRLDDATSEDYRLLIQEYGVKTIIDLRTRTERLQRNKAKIQHSQINSTTSAEKDNQLLEIKTHRINFLGRDLEIALLLMLSWWSFLKVLFFVLLGMRVSAARIIGREILVKQGLKGTAELSLRYCSKEIAEVLNILSCQQSSLNDSPETASQIYPVLIHCTQGKDRTGLVIILLLLILSHTTQENVSASNKDSTSFSTSFSGRASIRSNASTEGISSIESSTLTEGSISTKGSQTIEVSTSNENTASTEMKIPILSIATEYSLSTTALEPVKATLAREMLENTGIDDESWLEADISFLHHIIKLLNSWDGLEGYLFGNGSGWKGIGITREAIERCKDILRA